MNAITNAKFFTGGNALFTVSNASGKHYTFKIRQPKPKVDNKPMPFFVSLAGGEGAGHSHFQYMGVLDTQTLDVRLTARSCFDDEEEAYKVVGWAMKRVLNKVALPAGYAVQHNGKCCRCGRKLTDPASINNGYGSECAKHFSA